MVVFIHIPLLFSSKNTIFLWNDRIDKKKIRNQPEHQRHFWRNNEEFECQTDRSISIFAQYWQLVSESNNIFVSIFSEKVPNSFIRKSEDWLRTCTITSIEKPFHFLFQCCLIDLNLLELWTFPYTILFDWSVWSYWRHKMFAIRPFLLQTDSSDLFCHQSLEANLG